MKEPYKVLYHGTESMSRVLSIRQRIHHTATYCKNNGRQPVAFVIYDSNALELCSALLNAGYRVSLFVGQDPGYIDLPFGSLRIVVAKDAEEACAKACDVAVVWGLQNNSSLIKHLRAQNKEVHVLTVKERPKHAKRNITALDVVTQDNQNKGAGENKDPYLDMKFVKNYKPYKMAERPAIPMQLTEEVRELMPPKRQDPFAEN